MITPNRLLKAAVLSFTITAMCTMGASAACLGAGSVTAGALRLRDAPSTAGSILATASEGSKVVVLDNSSDGWYQVSYDNVQGYMSADWVDLLQTATCDLGRGAVTTSGSTLNLRSKPGTDGSILTSIPNGVVLQLDGVTGGWYLVTYSGKTGYVSSDYIAPTSDPITDSAAAVSQSNLGSQIAAYAQNYLGCKYVYGANGPSCFDCSGFTKYVYAQFGYTLNRTATGQLSNGVSVSKGELQPGDLVFFRHNTSKPVSHVGIYIGGGKFIHASTNAYKVQINDLSSGYYAGVYVYGRHVA
ncbi:MAG: NlpC/P60 family protein [Intestinimonas sp.]|jgi:cell wall-associated NlpC family hydrolase|nr:NlpC/P60 family protein [Intestinimonas sp.]